MDIWSGWTRQRRRNVAGLLLAVAVILLLVPVVLPGGARGADSQPDDAASGSGRLPVNATLPPSGTPAPTPAPAPADDAAEAESAEAGSQPAWTSDQIANLPVALDAAAVVAYDGKIWSIGGRAPDAPRRALRDVFIYDPATGRWSRGPSLPQAVSHAAAVDAGGELFVIGALNTARVPLTTVLRLEVGHDGWVHWVYGPPLPVPTAGGAAAWDGSRIVYGGGMLDGRTFTSTVWALQNGAWAQIGQLQQSRADLAAASDGQGRVWFMGGRNNGLDPAQLSDVDLATNQGVFPLVSDIAPTQGAAGVLWPGVGPCLIGGHGLPEGASQATFLDGVQCPNVDPGSLPTLSEPRAGAGAAVLGGQVYVIGGAGRGYTGSRIAEALRPAA